MNLFNPDMTAKLNFTRVHLFKIQLKKDRNIRQKKTEYNYKK